MTEKPSNTHLNDSNISLPDVWSELKERLDPTSTGSRYLISKDEDGSDHASRHLFNAHDIALNRPVSLKQLGRDDREDASKFDVFVKEARLTGNLQHPNIIPVHDLVPADDGSLYFTLRYVDGKKLQTILADTEGPFSLSEGMTIFTKICDAIAFAHSRGVYHTALSSEAIIIGNYGEVFVLDWGSAQKKSGQDNTHVFQDLTALGTILSTIAHRAAGADKLPISLEAIVNRVTRPIRSNYTSVDALREDISRFQSGLPTHAEEASVFRQLWLLSQRHKLETSMLSLAMIMAGIMTLWFIQNIQIKYTRTLKEAAVADSAHRAAIRHAEKEQTYLNKLKQLVPLINEQVEIDMKSGRFDQARERIEVALELTKDHPNWLLWEQYGDTLQALYQFEEAISAYKRIPLTDTNRKRIARKLAISQQYKGKATPQNTPDNLLMKFYLDMVETERVHEANYVITRFQKRQVDVLEDLRKRYKSGLPLINLPLSINRQTDIMIYLTPKEMKVDWSPKDRHSVTNFDAIKDIPFTSLTCKKGHDINSLDALRGKPLLSLKLLETNVSDLNPLADLPLKNLSILSSNISSLAPLSTVPLKTLAIHNSPYTSLAPLAEMQLTSLDISGSRVSTLSPLAHQRLESLMIARTPIKTLEGIDVSRLRALDISHTEFTTLSALNSAKLVTLNIADTSVADLTPLVGQPLEVVTLSRTNVESLSPLEGCPLTELNLTGCAITSLTPVAGAKTLNRLDISGLQVTEIPQNSWKLLEHLDAQKSSISSLTALQESPLRLVNLSNTAVSDISPLVNKKLYSLNLQNTKVTDLSALSGCNLRILNLSGTAVTDLMPLATVYLSSLNISNTPVTSLKGIEKLPLEALDIRNTAVKDLSVLKHSPLEDIQLSREQYRQNLATLQIMPFLKTCQVNGKALNPKSSRK